MSGALGIAAMGEGEFFAALAILADHEHYGGQVFFMLTEAERRWIRAYRLGRVPHAR